MAWYSGSSSIEDMVAVVYEGEVGMKVQTGIK
jgi:hypothetical protein